LLCSARLLQHRRRPHPICHATRAQSDSGEKRHHALVTTQQWHGVDECVCTITNCGRPVSVGMATSKERRDMTINYRHYHALQRTSAGRRGCNRPGSLRPSPSWAVLHRARVKRSIVLRFLLVSLFGLSGMSAHGQVYAIGVAGGPMVTLRVDEHRWLAGGWPNGYGLLQFRCRTGEGAPWIRYTTASFGRPVFTLRLPAVIVSAIPLSVASSLAWLLIGAGSRIRRLH
jgi:hypothetical protein